MLRSLLTLFLLIPLLAWSQDNLQNDPTDLQQSENYTENVDNLDDESQAKSLSKSVLNLNWKYRRLLKKKKRWQKKSLAKIDDSMEDLNRYEDQTYQWSDELFERFETLEACEAYEEPKEVKDVNDLQTFMMELKSYYQLLYWYWNSNIDPPVGESILASSKKVANLLERKKEAMALDEYTAYNEVNRINKGLERELDKLKILYNDSLEVAVNGSEIFRHLDFMHDLYPAIDEEIARRYQAREKSTEKEIIQRHYAALLLDMDEKYIASIDNAKQSNIKNRILIEKAIQLDPEEVQKFEALFRAFDGKSKKEKSQELSAFLSENY